MFIAVDFDGTIVEEAYPQIGRPIPFAIDALKRLQQEDHHQIVLWTVREGKYLEEAVEYCANQGLIFYAVNKNYPEEEVSSPRKLMADVFIDDRSVGGLPDWGMIYKMIKAGGKNLYNFDAIMMHDAEDSHYRRKDAKKNFFLRLGEAIERSKGNRY
jgi:hypothetical protein